MQVVTSGGSSGQISGGFTGDVSLSNPGDLNVTPSPTPPTPVSNYTQTATGNLTEVIGGLAAGTQYGQIVVNGSVNLDGSLQVRHVNGFVPTVGDSFTVIDNRGGDPIAGTFAGLPEGATLWAGVYGFTVSYVGGTGNDLVLTYSGLATTTLSGRVFDDLNDNGAFDGADAGLANVTVQLVGPTGTTVAETTTGADGTYTLTTVGSFAAGLYRVEVGVPTDGLIDGRETAGSRGGTVNNTSDSLAIADVPLAARDAASGYLFARIRPSRLQGLVWEDANDDGQVNLGERAIAGVLITLTGTDDRGAAVSRTMTTDGQGLYEFAGLRPGTYTVAEAQPAGYLDGRDVPGTVNGVTVGDASVNDRISGIALAQPGSDAVNYNFAERSASGSPVSAGQAATIGFWQNKNGQALIRSLNGGPTSTALGNWLASQFPNMYGPAAGAANDLTGRTNAQVADIYTALFKRNANTAPYGPPKLDAQVLTTALAVYVTNQSLAGSAGVSYGFKVSDVGLGAATFNVGTNGAAFAAADGSTVTVLDLLQRVNSRTRRGLLYDVDGSGKIDAAEQSLRAGANAVFSAINELGGI